MSASTPSTEVCLTAEDLAALINDGYSFSDALALSGIRRVGETIQQWQRRTQGILLRHALNGLGEALEEQRRQEGATWTP